MDRYDSYKASGIEWVGEIPSHWNRLRIKHTVLCSGGSFIDGDWIEAKDIAEEGIKYLTSGNVGVITYKEQGSGYITQETFEKLGCLDVYAGDILISRLNEPISRACIVPELNSRIVTCVDNVIYRPDKSIFDYRFVVYTLNNRYYTEHANLIARGTTMHRISRTTLGGLSIPVPTLAEQQAISDWLDKKCGEINRVIEKQSKRIELLEELKQSVITQAVTRGLNPNVALKKSGIEWIGEIPEHWERLRIKYTALGKDCSFIDGDWIELKDISQEGIKYLTSGNVGALKYKEQGSGYITQETFDKLGCFEVYAGDILISRLNEPISRACIVPELNSRIVTCVDNVIYRPNKSLLDYRFVVYVLNNYKYTEHTNLIARGATMHRIGRNTLGSLSIPIPPFNEQLEIADYLDAEIAKIDTQIAKVNKEIELLQEYKQSIITEVVTGKRKVC